jgi:hypothetical protein
MFPQTFYLKVMQLLMTDDFCNTTSQMLHRYHLPRIAALNYLAFFLSVSKLGLLVVIMLTMKVALHF